MKLIIELIEFALQHGMLTEENKRKLQDIGFYTFYNSVDEYCASYDREYSEQLEPDSHEDELDREYYGEFYHPGKSSGNRHHGKRKSPPVGPKLTVEELNQRVEEEWKKLTEDFPRLEPLWDSWKAGKLERVFADGFTLNDIYVLRNVERRDYHEFSGPAPTAYRQLLRQVGNTFGKYSWVIKSSEMASMLEFPRFRQQVLEDVRALYETDRERFGALSSQNGKLNFPNWEKAVKTDMTSMKVWTILNLTSIPVTPERIEEILTWKPELTLAMQINLNYITELLTKLEQGDWSSLTVRTECKIANTILKSVTIPEGVKAIVVAIPEGVTAIGDWAFKHCSSLTSVVIPKGVKEIGDNAFWGCSSLKSVTLPEGVKSIGNAAFRACSSLTSVTLPKGVTTIGNNAFRDCSSLTSVVIPECVTAIGWETFRGCSSLTSVVIPEGVKVIGERTFEGCCSLTSMVIPEGVTAIGYYAFFGCPNLTINAPAGSYAEKLAHAIRIPFQPLEEEK